MVLHEYTTWFCFWLLIIITDRVVYVVRHTYYNPGSYAPTAKNMEGPNFAMTVHIRVIISQLRYAQFMFRDIRFQPKPKLQ